MDSGEGSGIYRRYKMEGGREGNDGGTLTLRRLVSKSY